MILTVTLNPAVDKTCQIARLLPGEVNRLEKTFSVAGGKGINVTKILRQFHLPAAAMGFLGGYTGRMIEDAVMELGAECHFTRIQGETRTNVNLLGADGYVTELLEPGPEISKEELANFKKEFEYCLEQSSLVVLSGSVPKGVPADIYGELAARCRAEGRRVILDTSGELLREGVKEKPYMIKPNKRELEFLAGCRLADQEAVEEEAKRLVEQGVRKVVVSMGSRGILYVDREQTIFEPAKDVKVLNTVGCGDSVVASMAMSELAGEEPSMALKKAAALSAANAVTRESGKIPMDVYLELL